MSTIPLPPETPAPTLEHLVSLPQLIHPISPHLAALHLARIRLLLSIPAGYDLTNPAKRWCAHCGALREGAVETRLRRKKQSFTIGSEEIPGLVVKGKRRWECAVCGKSSKKLVPPAAVSPTGGLRATSARTSARLRKTKSMSDLQRLADAAEPLHADVMERTSGHDGDESADRPIDVQAMDLEAISAVDELDPFSASTTLQLHGTQGQTEPVDTSILLSAPIYRPPSSVLLSPRLSYIPGEAPQPPTYTQPTAKAPGVSPAPGKDGRKRRKKSGLAKLLAENKERQDAKDAGQGSWGLD